MSLNFIAPLEITEEELKSDPEKKREIRHKRQSGGQ